MTRGSSGVCRGRPPRSRHLGQLRGGAHGGVERGGQRDKHEQRGEDERVEVFLVSERLDPIKGTVAGTDGYGLLVEREGRTSVFISWGRVLMVEKVTR